MLQSSRQPDGSAVGKRLNRQRPPSVTCLEGRSRDSIGARLTASMNSISLDELAGTDFSFIVPPGEAELLAHRLAPSSRRAPKKPIYVDATRSVRARRRHRANRGNHRYSLCRCRYYRSRRNRGAGPVFYLSGEKAGEVAKLGAFGSPAKCSMDPLAPPRALKMSYGGITKGLTALASVMILAATRAGAADALRRSWPIASHASCLVRAPDSLDVQQGLSLGRRKWRKSPSSSPPMRPPRSVHRQRASL